MRQGRFDDGEVVGGLLGRQSRNDERKPWIVPAMPCTVPVSPICDRARPVRSDANTSPSLCSPRRSSRIAKAGSLSGTTCTRLLFMRSAGIVQVLPPRSISSHRAPRASADRLAVRIRNAAQLGRNPQRDCRGCCGTRSAHRGRVPHRGGA